MKKRIVSTLLLTTALCVAISNAAYAASATSATSELPMGRAVPDYLFIGANGTDLHPNPRFSYTDQVTVLLAFDGRTADCGVIVLGKDSATKITGTLSLQKKSSSGSYSSVKTWSISESSDEAIFTGTYKVSSAGDYRLIFSGKVYSGSSYENVSVNVEDSCD